MKVRDLAAALNGTAAQFEVEWNGEYLRLKGGEAYTPNGTEGVTPFSGQRDYERASEGHIRVNGYFGKGPGIFLHDDNGGGYTYYQLRDLGKGLGFNVGWSADRGVFLETDQPYDYSN